MCNTRDPGPRVRALLELVRDVADEIVVNIDSRAGDEESGQYGAVADVVNRFELSPAHSSLQFLHEQCRGDWVLLLAGDEVCSTEMISALPELIRSRREVQYSFSFRWLWPDGAHWLTQLPWHPEYHPRLVRNDGTLRFMGVQHELARRAEPHRWLDIPLWHLSLLVTDEAERRVKIARYQAEVQGLTAPGGEELNEAFYLPEHAGDLACAPVPDVDVEPIARVLSAAGEPLPPVEGMELFTRSVIEPRWAMRTVGSFAATVTPVAHDALDLRPNEHRTIFVRVRNDGDEWFSWGLDHPPLFRLGFRWHAAGGDALAVEEGRVGFPCDVRPGDEVVVPVPIRAPASEGSYELQLDVLLEYVRWCDTPCVIPAVVRV